jgi:hypothetical protein
MIITFRQLDEEVVEREQADIIVIGLSAASTPR